VNLGQLDGLVWLVICLAPFLVVQRWLHREIQAVFLLLTRRPDLTIGLFSLIFFPGVLLHETSHFLMAQLLRVRTGRFSVLPKVQPDGQLQLGFVETAKADFLRDAIIGMAPLLSGGVAIAYLGISRLGLVTLANYVPQAQWMQIWQALVQLPDLPDFWLWFYLAFTISSTMLPSASDRRAWLPLALILVTLAGIAILAGAGPWMLSNVAPRINQLLLTLATIFGTSLVLHLILAVPTGLLAHALSRAMRLKVV
jgi:hypothetical protein